MKRCWNRLVPLAGLVLLFAAAMHLHAQLPLSKGAPKVGEKAPDFTLPDSNGKPAKLSELVVAPMPDPFGAAGKSDAASEKPRWVLLVFYRGYW